jgi:hypothetical protein
MTKKPKLLPEQQQGDDTNVELPTIDDGSSIEEYAKNISDAWYQSIRGIIEAGELLINAKAQLPHGGFQTLFTEKRLPFGERTAQRLMAIAANPVLTNPTRASVLPRSWTTLHAMTTIPGPQLEKLLIDGQINSETERKEVEELAARIERDALITAIIEALTTLSGLIEKWPDATTLLPHLEGKVDLSKLTDWMAKLDPLHIPASLRRTES